MDEIQEYKHPDSILDYGRHWGDNPETGVAGWLHEDEIIVSSEWTVTAKKVGDDTLVEGAQGTGISLDGKTTSIFLEGGTDGNSYILDNKIITTDNNGVVRSETKSVLLHCKSGCI